MNPYSYYPAGYNVYNPYMQYQQPQVAQPAQSSGIQWVQGEAGAKAYNVGAGQSALLMDSESYTFYIKTCDASGMPSLRIFDYTERIAKNAPAAPQTGGIDTSAFITRTEFEERIAAITAPTRTLRKDTEDE